MEYERGGKGRCFTSVHKRLLLIGRRAKEAVSWDAARLSVQATGRRARIGVFPLHALPLQRQLCTRIDVHKDESHVAVLDDNGEVTEEIRVVMT